MELTRGRAIVLAAAGLIGAAGVVAAAGSAHVSASQAVASMATVCLAHAPVLVALALAGKGRWVGLAAVLLAVGTLVFAADMGLREVFGLRMPFAAPVGGVLMIVGWLAVATGGVVALRRSGNTLP